MVVDVGDVEKMSFYTHPYSTKPIYPSPLKQLVWWLLGIACIVLATVRKRSAMIGSSNVIVLEPFGMGDVVALQPLVWALCEEGKTVTVLCREAWLPILRPHPSLRTIGLRQDFKFTKHFLDLLAVLKHCHTGSSVTGIDPRGDIRSVLAFWLAGCGRVETLECYFTANDCPIPQRAATVVHPINRTVERYKLNQVFTTLPLEKPTLEHLRKPTLPHAQKTVGFITNTPWEGKRWNKWTELETALTAQSWMVKYLDCGSVQEWVEELPTCDVLISVNTGPMHIGAALEIPMVVLDGSSRLPLWAPVSDTAIVVHYQNDVDCAPCHQTGRCRVTNSCMNRITVDDVLAALARLAQS